MAAAKGGSMDDAIKKFGTKGGGKECSSKDLTKWCECAGVLGKKCNSNNLDIVFSQVRNKTTKFVGTAQIDDLCKKLADSYIADGHKMDKDAAAAEIKSKLQNAEKKFEGVTKTSKTGGVSKMTDASQYTGAHKERFDKDGKGKGIEGREERSENKGYVGNYKGEGSYEKKTKK